MREERKVKESGEKKVVEGKSRKMREICEGVGVVLERRVEGRGRRAEKGIRRKKENAWEKWEE